MAARGRSRDELSNIEGIKDGKNNRELFPLFLSSLPWSLTNTSIRKLPCHPRTSSSPSASSRSCRKHQISKFVEALTATLHLIAPTPSSSSLSFSCLPKLKSTKFLTKGTPRGSSSSSPHPPTSKWFQPRLSSHRQCLNPFHTRLSFTLLPSSTPGNWSSSDVWTRTGERPLKWPRLCGRTSTFQRWETRGWLSE